MTLRICTTCMVLVFVVILAAGDACSNGINPPRPSGTIAVKAICKERIDGHENEVFRTRIQGENEPVESLTFVIRGNKTQISLTDIKKITISADVDSNGFAKGSLILTDGTEEKVVKIQVKTKNKSIYLTGFSINGTKLGTDLYKCKSIEFSSVTTSNTNDKRVPAK